MTNQVMAPAENPNVHQNAPTWSPDLDAAYGSQLNTLQPYMRPGFGEAVTSLAEGYFQAERELAEQARREGRPVSDEEALLDLEEAVSLGRVRQPDDDTQAYHAGQLPDALADFLPPLHREYGTGREGDDR